MEIWCCVVGERSMSVGSVMLAHCPEHRSCEEPDAHGMSRWLPTILANRSPSRAISQPGPRLSLSTEESVEAACGRYHRQKSEGTQHMHVK